MGKLCPKEFHGDTLPFFSFFFPPLGSADFCFRLSFRGERSYPGGRGRGYCNFGGSNLLFGRNVNRGIISFTGIGNEKFARFVVAWVIASGVNEVGHRIDRRVLYPPVKNDENRRRIRFVAIVNGS